MEALPQGGWRAWTRRAEEASIGPGLGQRLRRGVLGNGAATAFMQASVLVGQARLSATQTRFIGIAEVATSARTAGSWDLAST